MPVSLDRLFATRLQKDHVFAEKDVILYALGLGLGSDNSDLHLVYEKGLQVLPTFGSVLGYPGFWMKDDLALGIDWRKVLNGEQAIHLHKPLPTQGKVVGDMRVVDVIDKGEGKDCLIYTVRTVRDHLGELLCEVLNTVVLRGHGGFGGPTVRSNDEFSARFKRPDRAADFVVDFPILRQAALIYRLSGDYNTLHADPAIALQAGFSRPILHGAATWGIAGYVMLRKLCGGAPALLRSFGARFTSPVFPGDSLQTEIWTLEPGRAFFRCTVPARDKVVLDAGEFTFTTD